jgi:hypothetical protein
MVLLQATIYETPMAVQARDVSVAWFCRQGKPPRAAVLVLLDCWLTNGADKSPHRIRDKCRPRRARSIHSFSFVA